MGTKGRFKYICEDCSAENWLTSRERGSRFKPRCTQCGSTWLEPSKKSEGPKKLAERADAVREQKARIDKKMGK